MKNFTLSSIIAKILTLFGLAGFNLLLVNPSQAVTFDFSFSSGIEGPFDGTVAGKVVLPDGDGTFSATAITINSAPPGLGFSFPLNLDFLNGDYSIYQNSFTVAGGSIDLFNSRFEIENIRFETEFNRTILFGLNTSPVFFGSRYNYLVTEVFDLSGGTSLAGTVTDVSTLSYTKAVPEPLTILGAVTAAGFGAGFKRKLAKTKKDKKDI
jgi:hypothetical protein